jgi:hypothetical protein
VYLEPKQVFDIPVADVAVQLHLERDGGAFSVVDNEVDLVVAFTGAEVGNGGFSRLRVGVQAEGDERFE